MSTIYEMSNNALVLLCKIKREADNMHKKQIQNRLQEFMMLDKLAQRIQHFPDPKDDAALCHELMAKIVQELAPFHDEIIKEKPELEEAFKLFDNYGK